MQATVTDTYQGERTAQMCMLVTRMCVAVYYWFFISYRYIVAVIFTQMLVGILVSAFQTSVEDAATLQGQVRLRLRDCGSEMLTAKQQVKLQRELGTVARMHIDAEQPMTSKISMTVDVDAKGAVEVEMNPICTLTSETNSTSIADTASRAGNATNPLSHGSSAEDSVIYIDHTSRYAQVM